MNFMCYTQHIDGMLSMKKNIFHDIFKITCFKSIHKQIKMMQDSRTGYFPSTNKEHE